MKGSLRKKYIAAGCLLIVGFLACLFVAVLFLKESVVEEWNHRRLNAIALEVRNPLLKEEWDVSREYMDNVAAENDVTIAVTDENLEILFSTRSWETARGVLGEKTQKAIHDDKAELDNTGNSFASYYDDANSAFFVEVVKVPEYGYIIVRKSITGLNSSMQVMAICFLIAAGITMVCGTLAIIYLSGKMVRPIQEINKVTGQIANLNFDEKAMVKSNDEFGALAESVNVMSDRLKESMGELQKEVEMRKVLVRNMAHELKTPVAVVMGYAENMTYIKDQPEKIEKYCKVISEECGRMDIIVHQMIEDSSFKQGENSVDKTYFQVQPLLDSIRRCYQDEFPERTGAYVEVNEVRGDVWGDLEMIQRALYNFIKNAVSYGKKDGEIRICAREEHEFVHFVVFNQGNPIPEEEQEKIWNVFYKVNTARTRNRNSFGIGLSIVKQAAEAHGGSVGVRNVPGGVEFRFTIKNK